VHFRSHDDNGITIGSWKHDLDTGSVKARHAANGIAPRINHVVGTEELSHPSGEAHFTACGIYQVKYIARSVSGIEGFARNRPSISEQGGLHPL
jgi:hypothetical protein